MASLLQMDTPDFRHHNVDQQQSQTIDGTYNRCDLQEGATRVQEARLIHPEGARLVDIPIMKPAFGRHRLYHDFLRCCAFLSDSFSFFGYGLCCCLRRHSCIWTSPDWADIRRFFHLKRTNISLASYGPFRR